MYLHTLQKGLQMLLFVGVASVCSLLAFSARAQGNIKGTITDEKNQPVFGATVQIVGSSQGAATDATGGFLIEGVPDGDRQIQISFIGYTDKVVPVKVVKGQTTQTDAQLGENSELIDEVVVVGYGTQQKRDVTGAIAKVEGKTITGLQTSSFEQGLQGNASGVQVVQGSGVVGSASVVRIRGNGSISAGGDPLYVVDGIPISQSYFLSGGSNGGTNNNPLSSLNPNDIESVEVLKDAAATAIFGSRGGNGVIIITTKRGKDKSGKPQFTFGVRAGWSEPTKTLDFLSSEEYAQLRQRAWELDGNTGIAPLHPTLAATGYSRNELEHMNHDWMKDVLRTGYKQEYNLGMSLGTEKVKTYIGASYSDNKGYIIDNGQTRASLRANVDWQATKKFKVSVSTSLSQTLLNKANLLNKGLGAALWYNNASTPVYMKNGDFFNWSRNPVAASQHTKEDSREFRSINSLNLSYDILDNLTANASVNYDYQDYNDYYFADSLWQQKANGATTPYDRKSYTNEAKKITNNASAYATLSYRFKLPKAHSLTLLVGGEAQQSYRRYGQIEYRGANDIYYKATNLSDASTLRSGTTRLSAVGQDSSFFASVFARANYSFKNRYQIQAVFRRDGSTRFGENRRFANFPSIGLGYVVSEENFFKPLKKTVNFFKLRGSWGISGNSNIPNTQAQYPGYSYNRPGDINAGNTYNGQPIRYVSTPANPNLQWEDVKTVDGGFQLGLFNDRLQIDATYYYKLTSNAFLKTRLAASAGIGGDFYQNIGVIENKGVDVTITSNNIRNRKADGLSWKTSVSFGFNRNKVLDVGPTSPDALDGGFGDTRAVVGYPVGTNLLVPYAGIDPATGKPLYYDANGNLTFKYDPNNRKPVGDIFPLFTGGITNTFTYKNFDLNFLFVYSYGGKIYDDAAKRQRTPIVPDDLLFNQTKEVLDYWTKPGDMTSKPRPTMVGSTYGLDQIWQNNTNGYVEDASYIRLRNLTFGYTFKTKSKYVANPRIYFTGTNLLLFTNYKGWDPEVGRERENEQQRNVGGTNVTFLTPPQERSYVFGFDISF